MDFQAHGLECENTHFAGWMCNKVQVMSKTRRSSSSMEVKIHSQSTNHLVVQNGVRADCHDILENRT